MASANYSSKKVPSNISPDLTANGTADTSTTIIGSNAFYSDVTTCTSAAHALTLPRFPTLGKPYIVKNTGAHNATVFPAPAGTGASTIDGASSFVLANNGSEASFICVNSAPNTTADVTNPTLTWKSFGKSGKSVIATTGAVTLLPCIHYDNQVHVSQAAAYAIGIPNPEDAIGMKIEFVNEVEGANTVTISSGGADLSGIILLGDAAGVVKVIDQDTTLSMVATHCQIGDRCVMTSDGTNWSCMIMSQSLDANDGWTVA